MIITMEHMRKATFCVSGVEAFFQRHDLDFSAFLAHGIHDDELLNTDSPLARRVVYIAHQERHNGR